MAGYSTFVMDQGHHHHVPQMSGTILDQSLEHHHHLQAPIEPLMIDPSQQCGMNPFDNPPQYSPDPFMAHQNWNESIVQMGPDSVNPRLGVPRIPPPPSIRSDPLPGALLTSIRENLGNRRDEFLENLDSIVIPGLLDKLVNAIYEALLEPMVLAKASILLREMIQNELNNADAENLIMEGMIEKFGPGIADALRALKDGSFVCALPCICIAPSLTGDPFAMANGMSSTCTQR